MGKLPGIFAGLLVVLMSMPSNLGSLFGPSSGEFSLTPVVLTSGFLVGLSIVASRLGAARQVLRNINPYFLVFLALATVSVLWSVEPDTTLRRLYRLYSLSIVCLSFVLIGWRPKRFLTILLPGLSFLCIASIFYYLAYPEGAIEPSKIGNYIMPELIDAWRGVTLHKNTLGAIASTAVVLWVYALVTRQANRIAALVGLPAALVCLVESRSSTAMFSAIFGVALLLLIVRAPPARVRRFIPYLVTVLTALFLIYSLGVLNIIPGLGAVIEPLVSLTGKDMSFSGRTTIWAILKDEILRHPVLGIGYAAFWTGENPAAASYAFVRRMYIYPGEAHNGYLDVINELGFVGGIALIAYLFIFLRQSVKLMKADRSRGSLFLALLFAEFISNLSEAHSWNLANVHFFIMTLATFDLAKSLLELKRGRAGGLPMPGGPVPGGPVPVRWVAGRRFR